MTSWTESMVTPYLRPNVHVPDYTREHMTNFVLEVCLFKWEVSSSSSSNHSRPDQTCSDFGEVLWLVTFYIGNLFLKNYFMCFCLLFYFIKKNLSFIHLITKWKANSIEVFCRSFLIGSDRIGNLLFFIKLGSDLGFKGLQLVGF